MQMLSVKNVIKRGLNFGLFLFMVSVVFDLIRILFGIAVGTILGFDELLRKIEGALVGVAILNAKVFLLGFIMGAALCVGRCYRGLNLPFIVVLALGSALFVTSEGSKSYGFETGSLVSIIVFSLFAIACAVALAQQQKSWMKKEEEALKSNARTMGS